MRSIPPDVRGYSNLACLFINQNICCMWVGSFEHSKYMFELMDKKIIIILRSNYFCFSGHYGSKPAHKISVLIAYAQKPPLDTYADLSSVDRSLNFGPSLHLRSNFVYACNKGSGKIADVQAHLSLLLTNALSTFKNRVCLLIIKYILHSRV